MESKFVAQKPEPKSNKDDASDPQEDRKGFSYSTHHDGMDNYGVIVEWTEKYLTHNQIFNKFESVLSTLRKPPIDESQNKCPKRSIKHKPIPYFRRTGRYKGIVTFDLWPEANTFSTMKHAGFRAYIPMAFIVTIGVVYFNLPKIHIKDAFACCLGEYDIMQWRIKRLEPNKQRVTFAVRGTELPKSILFNDKKHPVEQYIRQPARCSRCLRYGHRTGCCFRRARCGTCAEQRPTTWHAERVCRVLKIDRSKARCTYCNEGHDAGGVGCAEENYQRTYKAQLTKHKMDFVKTLESEIIPMVRSTSINSNRIWCDSSRKSGNESV